MLPGPNINNSPIFLITFGATLLNVVLATANDNATIVIKTTDLQKSAAVLENAGIPLVKVTDIEG